ESQHCVGAIAMIVDQLVGKLCRAWRAGGSQRQPRQHIRRNVVTLRFHLAPCDVAILVDVETEREIEITKRDVPLADNPFVLDLEREVAVRGLVSISRGRNASRRKRHCDDELPLHFALAIPAATNAATAGYSRPVSASQRCTMRSAAASFAAAATSARIRKSAASRCTCQLATA